MRDLLEGRKDFYLPRLLICNHPSTVRSFCASGDDQIRGGALFWVGRNVIPLSNLVII
jgi:hypothetical protein